LIFINIIRYFIGFVTFTARGGFSERFINLCSQNRVVLWDIRNKGGVIYANTSIKGYKRIRDSAKRSAMMVRLHKKHGAPFLMNKYRSRAGFMVGAVVFLMIIGLLSTRVWTINVEGNVTMTDKEILQVFEELGVYTGAKISKIDVTSVQEKAKIEFKDLSWLAVNITGSTATIEVREGIKKPPIEDQNPCNIVATYGGQIVKLEVYEGTSQQELGAAVAKGDLLISGVVENLDGSSELRHAKGIVIAKTDRNLKQTQPKQITKKVQIDEKKRYRLLFFGLDIPLFWLSDNEKNTEYYSHEHRLTLAGSILPVGFIKEGYKIYEEKDITLEETNCELLAFETFSNVQRKKFEKVEILGETVEVLKDNENCTIIGTYICKENICTKQEIFVE